MYLFGETRERGKSHNVCLLLNDGNTGGPLPAYNQKEINVSILRTFQMSILVECKVKINPPCRTLSETRGRMMTTMLISFSPSACPRGICEDDAASLLLIWALISFPSKNNSLLFEKAVLFWIIFIMYNCLYLFTDSLMPHCVLSATSCFQGCSVIWLKDKENVDYYSEAHLHNDLIQHIFLHCSNRISVR